jgi:cell division protein FtsL
MKYFKSYKSFKEKYSIDNNDTPEVTNSKNYLNKLETDIMEYNSKKMTLDTIYKTYVDDTDLINKLKSSKFILDDKKNFTNTLLGMYSQISSKNRKITDLENQISKGKTDLIDVKNKVQGNPTLQNSIQSDIDNINKKIADKTKDISDLDNQIKDLSKIINDKVIEMKKEFTDQKKILDQSEKK